MRRAAARQIARAGFALLAGALIVAAPRSPTAQPDTRIPWVGFLANEPTPDSVPVLREGLRERDWVEGQSVKIWYRYVQGKPELYQQHADDLVRLNVAVIVAVGPQAIEAAKMLAGGGGTLLCLGHVRQRHRRTVEATEVHLERAPTTCWLIIDTPLRRQ